MAATIRLLQERSESLHDLSKLTGLPFYWLQAFSAGTIKNPSVNRVQALYEYLAGKPLEV